MAPLEIQVGEKYETLWDELRAQRLPADARRRHDALGRRAARRSIAAASTWSKWSSIASSCGRDARSRIADSVEKALALGKGVLHVAWPDDDRPEAQMARSKRSASTSPADSAAAASSRSRPTLFVQQLARLVPVVRRTGHADRREPGGAAARSEADAARRARSRCGPSLDAAAVRGDARGAGRGTSACRSTCRSMRSPPGSGGS